MNKDYGPKIPSFTFEDYPRLTVIALRSVTDPSRENPRFMADCQAVANAIESGEVLLVSRVDLIRLYVGDSPAMTIERLLGPDQERPRRW